MESKNWRLCEQHKYYVKLNKSLLLLSRYRETISVTGSVRGKYSSMSNDSYSSVSNYSYSWSIPNVRMNVEEKPSQAKVLTKARDLREEQVDFP